jgi:hypothetical protein
MRRFLPGVINFLMTGFAGLRSHVLGNVGGRRTGHGCAGGLSALIDNLLANLAWSKGDDHEKT